MNAYDLSVRRALYAEAVAEDGVVAKGILADWLEDRGLPDQAALVRLYASPDGLGRQDALGDLMTAAGRVRVALRRELYEATGRRWHVEGTSYQEPGRGGDAFGGDERFEGIIRMRTFCPELASCNHASWLEVGPAVVRLYPLRAVRLANRRPLMIRPSRPTEAEPSSYVYGWCRARFLSEPEAGHSWREYEVSEDVFELLADRPGYAGVAASGTSDAVFHTFSSRDAAEQALNDVALQWAERVYQMEEALG